MKVLFFFKSGDLLLLKSGEFKFANYIHSTAIRFLLPHSTIFATPQQHARMVARLLPSHLFFGLPDAFSRTFHVMATVNHEKTTQRNRASDPGKLLRPSHFQK